MLPPLIYNNIFKDTFQYNYVFITILCNDFPTQKIMLTVKMSFLDCKNVFFNCKNVFFKTQISRFYAVFSVP